MIDRSKEKTFPLRDLPKAVGITRNYNAVYVWSTKGLTNYHTKKVIKLETIRGPSGKETSEEAYYRFLERLDARG